MKKRLTVLLILTFTLTASAGAPLNVLTDSGDSFNAVIVEKDKKKLHVVRVTGNGVSEVKSVTVMTGRGDGDKRVQGDAKTPEGVYRITGFLSPQRLKNMYGDASKIYGYGAFPLSYPNRLDELMGKTGGGIWIHGVENNRQDPSTKGCVAFDNDDVRAVAKYISAGTPVVITRNAIKGTSSQYRRMFEAVKTTVTRYLKAWGENDYDGFRDAYSRNFRSNDGRSLSSYLAYKKGLVAAYPVRLLSADKFRVFYESENEAVAQFNQYYTTANMSSYGRKTLYLRREDGSMKIVAEDFEQTRGWTVNPSTVLVRAETPKKPMTVAMAEPVKKQPAPETAIKKPSKSMIVAMTALPKPPRAEKYIKPESKAEVPVLMAEKPTVKNPIILAIADLTQPEKTEPVVESAPVVKSEPIAKAEPVVKPESKAAPVISEPEPDMFREPMQKPAVLAKAAPVTQPEQKTAVSEAPHKTVEEVIATNEANDHKDISDFVSVWAKAWESKDIDRYIALYSDSFKAGGMNLAAWKKDKGRKFTSLKNIVVQVGDIKVDDTSANRYAVTFIQSYTGDTYHDTGYKTLTLDSSSGDLRIVAETYRHAKVKITEPVVAKVIAPEPVIVAKAPVVIAPAQPVAQAKAEPVKPAAPAKTGSVVLSETVLLPAPESALAKPAQKETPKPKAPIAVAPAQPVAQAKAEPAKPVAPAKTGSVVLSETVLLPLPDKQSAETVDMTSAAEDFLAKWKSAWENRDIEQYISMYADTFRSGRMNLAAWKADKQRKFAALSEVHVEMDDMKVTKVSEHVYDVVFTQKYTGDRYSDTGIKTMRLDNGSGAMRITSEQWRAK